MDTTKALNSLINNTKTSSTTHSLTKSQKSYSTIDTDTGRIVTFDASANMPICSNENREAIQQLFVLMGLSAKQQGLDKNQKLLNYIALRENKVTVDEAHTAFWQAMADPYVPANTGIEVRHLMKYISKQREQNSQKQTLYTYDEAMRICEKETGTLSIDKFFDKQEQTNGGKPLWKRK